jgi:hypothetical protein
MDETGWSPQSPKYPTQKALANQTSVPGEVHMKNRAAANSGRQNLRERAHIHQTLTKPAPSLRRINSFCARIARECRNMAKSYVSRNSRTDHLDDTRDAALHVNIRAHADNLNLFCHVPFLQYLHVS